MGRPKLDMIFISLKIPPSWKKRLAKLSEHLGISKSQIMREDIEKGMNEREKKIKKNKS